MASSFALAAPGPKPIDLLNANRTAQSKVAAGAGLSDAAKAKTKATAQNFEAVFLNSMFERGAA